MLKKIHKKKEKKKNKQTKDDGSHLQRFKDMLETNGFKLIEYALLSKGQSVQWCLCSSIDNPSTLFLTFKGSDQPLDAMVNVGQMPLFVDEFQCSVFSGDLSFFCLFFF